MKTGKIALPLSTVLCLALLATAQNPDWESYTQAAKKAYQQGQYAEAEKLFRAALTVAEKFGDKDPRLLRKTKRDAEAAKMEERAKAIRSKLGFGKAKDC